MQLIPWKAIVCMLILVFLPLQAGCWNAREIDELAFVLGIALDRGQEGGVKVTVLIANPSAATRTPTGGGEQAKPFNVASAEGKTFFEAIRNMATFSSRRIFWAHNKVIVISEELARSDISEILDFFSRNPELRLRTWVAVTPGAAGKLFEVPSEMEKDPATAIENIIAQRVWTGKGYGVMLKDFLEDYLSANTYPVASRISVDNQGVSQLSGAAVFNENKLAGWLDGQETRGLLWLKGDLHSGIVVIPCPLDRQPLSVEVVHSEVKFMPHFRNDRPQLAVMVHVTGNLSEQACKTDFTDMENLRALKTVLSSAVKDDINAAVTAAQKQFKLDFPGFNRPFHLKHDRKWRHIVKDWPELFPDMEVMVHVKADIPRESLFAIPLKPQKAAPGQ